MGIVIEREKLLIRLTSLIVLIFALNFFANKFHWYFFVWYFDMPMHFLGGFWLGLTIIWLFNLENMPPRLIFKIILGVLLIGIGWELFEFLFNNYIAQNQFNIPDTVSDIFFDLAGGVFAISLFLRKNYASTSK